MSRQNNLFVLMPSADKVQGERVRNAYLKMLYPDRFDPRHFDTHNYYDFNKSNQIIGSVRPIKSNNYEQKQQH
jgi:hypothetical protein